MYISHFSSSSGLTKVFLYRVFFRVNFFLQMGHTLKIFEGTRICWVGISDDEVQQMNEILASHGGQVTQLDDPDCTHVVRTIE